MSFDSDAQRRAFFGKIKKLKGRIDRAVKKRISASKDYDFDMDRTDTMFDRDARKTSIRNAATKKLDKAHKAEWKLKTKLQNKKLK